MIARARGAARSTRCLAQLRQNSSGFLQYAADYDKRLPDPFVLQTSWEQLLHAYLGNDEVFRCVGDGELFQTIGSSFDWRDTGRADTTLAGKLVTDSSRGDCVLAFEALPGWHEKGRMNAALLNGAASSMDQDACMGDLQTSIRADASEAARAAKRRTAPR